MKEAITKRLEDAKRIAFLTLANTGDLMKDAVYDEVMVYMNTAIEIVNQVAEEYNQSLTNTDRIRAMSDEDLAMNMMCPNESGLADIECDRSDNCNCYECILKWLRLEVEEDHE